MEDSVRMIDLRLPSFLLLIIANLLAACGGSGSNEPAQPPVIVVQAPPETAPAQAGSTDPAYPGLAWQTPKTNPSSAAGAAGADNKSNPDAEPYDVVALLREFDPELTDAPKDQLGEGAFDDILSAHAVADDTYLYGRLVTRAPMQGEDIREVRFWIEQDDGKKMATVELKIGTRGSPCELSDVKNPEAQSTVNRCFWIGNAIDFRIPLSSVPKNINTKEPFHVSGFQTCCKDSERSQPYDELEGAQGVWRVPGVASEVETK